MKSKHWARRWPVMVMRFLMGWRRAFAVRRWWAFKFQRRFKVLFADHKGMYYVPVLAGVRSAWMGTATYADFPPPEHDLKREVYNQFGSFVLGFGMQTDKPYWRACLPFPFWKVRTRLNVEKRLRRDNPLVQDYMSLECHMEQEYVR